MIFGEGNVINARYCFQKHDPIRSISNFLWFCKFEKTLQMEEGKKEHDQNLDDQIRRGERLLKIMEKRRVNGF